MAAHLSEVQWAPTTITEADRHFHNSTQPTYHTARVPSAPFEIWELEEVLQDVKKGKAPGLDDIAPDDVKLLNDHSRAHRKRYSDCWSRNLHEPCWLSVKPE